MAEVNRLILLRRIRYLGVPLIEAKALLSGATDSRCVDVQQELLHLVNVRIVVLDQEIAELQHLRDEMEVYQQKLTHCPPDEREPFRSCVDLSCIAVSDEGT
jgi:DNA-binding transcriptional MerR regulator